jgi:hypothetical protein
MMTNRIVIMRLHIGVAGDKLREIMFHEASSHYSSVSECHHPPRMPDRVQCLPITINSLDSNAMVSSVSTKRHDSNATTPNAPLCADPTRQKKLSLITRKRLKETKATETPLSSKAVA